jgi:hypothetical protein
MLRNNQQRARMARLIFLLLMLNTGSLLVLSLLAQLQPDWASDVANISYKLLAAIYYLYAFLSFSYILLVIASYTTLIMWLRRAYYNLHQLPNIHPEFSDGWAAGAWFVPFVNFWRPYTIMREVWQATQRAALGRIVEPATLLGWWWAAYLLKLVIARITWHMGSSFSSDTITQEDMLATTLEAGTQFIAAGFAWYVIGRMATFEEELTVRQQIDQLGQPIALPVSHKTDQSGYALEEGY